MRCVGKDCPPPRLSRVPCTWGKIAPTLSYAYQIAHYVWLADLNVGRYAETPFGFAASPSARASRGCVRAYRLLPHT